MLDVHASYVYTIKREIGILILKQCTKLASHLYTAYYIFCLLRHRNGWKRCGSGSRVKLEGLVRCKLMIYDCNMLTIVSDETVEVMLVMRCVGSV